MDYRKAVFCVTYAKSKGKVEYLILKRKLHWKGWEFPKGGLNRFEFKRKAVRRELKEETGLDPLKLNRFDFSGKYKYNKKLSDRKGFQGQTFTLYSAEVKKTKRISLDKKEHEGYKWVSLKQALKLLKWPNQKESIKIVDNWLKEKSH